MTDGEVRAGLARVEAVLGTVAGTYGVIRRCHAPLVSPRSKRLRPALVLLAARLGGAGIRPEVVRAAAGLELLHQATLCHDDIVDEAPQRRGGPSVQAACGAPAAALAGSELLYASVELFAELPRTLRRAVGHAGERLCRGQLRELELVGQSSVTVSERLRVMRDKTASLFELGGRLGAALAGAGPTEIARLVRFGRCVGLAFQLADDLRDLLVSPQELGRPRFGDLRDGVYTLPVLYVLGGSGLSVTLLRGAVMGPRTGVLTRSPEDVVRIVRAAGGFRRAAGQLRRWVAEARACIPEGSGTEAAVADLHRLAAGLVRHAGVEETTNDEEPVHSLDSDALERACV